MDYVTKYIGQFDDVSLDTQTIEGAQVYTVGQTLFAIYYPDKKPKAISLRGDRQLMKELRERYESVVPPPNLDRQTWNTYLLTPQFDDEFITSMILHSYIESGGNYLS